MASSNSNESKKTAISCAVIAVLCFAVGLCDTCVGCSGMSSCVSSKYRTNSASPSNHSEQSDASEYMMGSFEDYQVTSVHTEEQTIQTEYDVYPEQTEPFFTEDNTSIVTAATEEPAYEETWELSYGGYTEEYYQYQEETQESYQPDADQEICLVDLLGMTLDYTDSLFGTDSVWDYISEDGLYCRTYESGAIYIYSDDSGEIVQATCWPESTYITKVDEFGHYVNMTVSELQDLIGEDMFDNDEEYDRYYAYYYPYYYGDFDIAYFYAFDNDDPDTSNQLVTVCYFER